MTISFSLRVRRKERERERKRERERAPCFSVKKMAMAEGVANEVVIGNAEDSCPPSHRHIHCIVKLGMMSFLTFFPHYHVFNTFD
jgi:hypothetical protein